MTVLPGSGVCKTCGDSIEDSCGGETRNCAFCRKLKTPYEPLPDDSPKRFVASVVGRW